MYKKQYRNREKAAVCWLSIAVGILLAAMIGMAFTGYRLIRNRVEKDALLTASDILAYAQCRRNGDGRQAIYEAMVECRLSGMPGDWKMENIRKIIADEEFTQTLNRALETGVFSAEYLRCALREYSDEPPCTLKNKDVEKPPAANLLRTEKGSVLAEANLGIQFLRDAEYSRNRIAFCRNVYAEFPTKNTKPMAYTSAVSIAGKKLSVQECEKIAEKYLRENGWKSYAAVQMQEKGGIWYSLYKKEEREILLGIREASGSICFFLSRSKNPGNVLQ